MPHQNISWWPVVCAWRVCRLSLILIHRTAHGSTRHHLSTYHLRLLSGSNAPSPELLAQGCDQSPHHPHQSSAKEMPGILDSVGGDYSLEPSPRPLQFYLYKGMALWREGPLSPYFTCTRRALTWIARCFTWSSCKRKPGCPSDILPTLFRVGRLSYSLPSTSLWMARCT